MNLEVKDYIIFIMILFILFLLYKKYISKANFENTNIQDNILDLINDSYRTDLSPIRRLGELLSDLTEDSTKNINFSEYGINKLILNNLYVNDNDNDNDQMVSYKTQNLNIHNNFIVNNDVYYKFNINIIPRGIIIAWYNNQIPRGWVLCDGTVYYINKNDNNYKNIKPIDINNYDVFITPNLINRFILGSDVNNIGNTGGVETVSLKFTEMPSHTHTGTKIIQNKMITKKCTDCDFKIIKHNKYPFDNSTYRYNIISMDPENEKNESLVYALNRNIRENDNNIAAEPHENLPPYYRLYYIIKI